MIAVDEASLCWPAGLAQPMRLRVFRALVGAGPQGMTPGALAAMLDVPASTLSFHLKELIHAGLAPQQRDGRNLIYRPSLDADERADRLPHRALLPGCGPVAALLAPRRPTLLTRKDFHEPIPRPPARRRSRRQRGMSGPSAAGR